MLNAILPDILKATVMLTSAFNFFVLVFFYERDGGAKRKMIYSASALLIAVGQLYYCLSAYSGNTVEWPQVAAQLGLTCVLAAAMGSVKRAASYLIDHCGGCRALKRD